MSGTAVVAAVVAVIAVVATADNGSWRGHIAVGHLQFFFASRINFFLKFYF